MDLSALPLPLALVGYGVSNRALHRLLRIQGFDETQIHIFDEASAQIDGAEFLSQSGARSLFVSPGYPLSKPWIQKAVKDGVQLSSEIDWASRFLVGEKLLGITGSLAKSTVTSLVALGLQTAGRQVFVGGNLGFPLADYMSDCLEGKRSRADFLVLELSSYQLEILTRKDFAGAVLTYLCANHLDRYQSLEHYYKTKTQLLDLSCGPKVVNAQSEEIQKFCADRKDLIWAAKSHSQYLSDEELAQKSLLGEHNKHNLALAFEFIGEFVSINSQIKEKLLSFSGLDHRLQYFAANGHRPFHVVDDSKATSIESVIAAAEAIRYEKKSRQMKDSTVWHLLGGRDKDLPWQELGKLRDFSGFRFEFFGEAAQKIKQLTAFEGPVYQSLEIALDTIYPRLNADDWVLLSPGGSSLDEFKNFEQRGRFFQSKMLNSPA